MDFKCLPAPPPTPPQPQPLAFTGKCLVFPVMTFHAAYRANAMNGATARRQ